jgi:hypothetical protein|tara:strand:+ start:2766 stop:2987 length:222 start_codon:yes stop_codon:yes gene_type:complete
MDEIEKLKEEIRRLKELVEMERKVKECEVLLNKEFRLNVNRLQTEKNTLLKNNKEYLDRISQLELLLEEVRLK